MYEDYVHYVTHGYFDKPSKKIVEYLTLFYCDKTITELVVPTKKAYELFKQKYKVDKIYIPNEIDIDMNYPEDVTVTEGLNVSANFNVVIAEPGRL